MKRNARHEITFTRCTGQDADFRALVDALDEELNERYGAQMAFFGQYNHSHDVASALVAWVDGDGTRHERRMFLDPVELPAGTAPAGSQSPASFPQGTQAVPGGAPPSSGMPPGPAGQRRGRAG